ncbi:hypothetical protein D3C86_1891080 [compost metagenome]
MDDAATAPPKSSAKGTTTMAVARMGLVERAIWVPTAPILSQISTPATVAPVARP